MKVKKERNKGEEATLEMTPMIDVVFQLLIFFIVTLKPVDILSSLEALRPAPDSSVSTPSADEPITISIGKEGFFFNDTILSESALKKSVKQIARMNKDAMVIVKCTGESRHGYLVGALDILASAGMNKVSVFSL